MAAAKTMAVTGTTVTCSSNGGSAVAVPKATLLIAAVGATVLLRNFLKFS